MNSYSAVLRVISLLTILKISSIHCGGIVCEPGFIVDNNNCRLPTFGESCNGKCQETLTCVSENGEWLCACSERDAYFDVDSGSCKTVPGYAERCVSVCADPLECIAVEPGNNQCLCSIPERHYFDDITRQCMNKKTKDDACGSNEECQDPFFVCQSGVCGCLDSVQYWDGSSCQYKKAVGEGCSNDHDDCMTSLQCIDRLCSCDWHLEYFEGNMCISKKHFGQSCFSSDNECMDTMDCMNGVCACPSDTYLEGGLCKQRKQFGQSCSFDIYKDCMETMDCINGVCDCQSDTFLEGGCCKQRKSFDSVCGSLVECMETLTCGPDQTCTCSDSDYPDGERCEPRKARGGLCSHGDQCQVTMTCLINKVCGCDDRVQYWNGNLCEAKRSRSDGCNIDIECQSPFICNNGICDCTNDQYYYQGYCVTKKDKDEACSSSDECEGQLTCLSGKCDCPIDMFFQVWDCQARKKKDDACSANPTFPRECEDPFVCVNNWCDCQDSQYYTGSTCATKKGYNTRCTNPIECADPFTCSSSKCLCHSTHYYEDGECHKKFNLIQFCTTSTECHDTHSTCVRPRTGTNRMMCLCKDEYFHDTIANNCSPLSELNVRDCFVSDHSDNSVSFTWTAESYGKSVTYEMVSTAVGTLQTASANGGKVLGLKAGSKFDFSVVSTLAQDIYYRESKTTYSYGSAWTKPSTPGGFDATQSQLMKNPMTFGFFPSEGAVSQYRVTLVRGEGSITRTTTTNKVTNLYLDSGEKYAYGIVAINANQDLSEEVSKGFFDTGHEPSGPVRELTVDSITTTTATATWKTPQEPKGSVQAFTAFVIVGDRCLLAYHLYCIDYLNNEIPSYTSCGKTTGIKFSCEEAENLNHVFSTKIPSLSVYTNYEVTVYAITEAGNGNPATKPFKTQESAPEAVVSVNVTGIRDTARHVNLQVTWTPGKETGVTTYEVEVLHKNDGTRAVMNRLTPYTRTSHRFGNVLAYHDYIVSVIAETKLGRSKPVFKGIRTATTNPSAPRNLKVVKDPIYATAMHLELDCPTTWNGPIEGFYIYQTGYPDPFIVQASDEDCESVISVKSSRLGNFVVNSRYTLDVRAKNMDFETYTRTAVGFNPVAMAPVFEEQVLFRDSKMAATNTSVSVSMCTSCLTSPSQGKITNAGLIVCVKSENNTCIANRRKRAALTEATFKSYPTWGQARADYFIPHYRTTPNDWITTLQNDLPDWYTIGQDTDCGTDVREYCNGPLPVKRDIIVTAVACTSAGCQESTPLLITRTGEDSDSAFGTEIIIGVVAGVVLLVVVVIIVIIVCRVKRKETNRRPPSLSELTLSESVRIAHQGGKRQSLSRNESRPIKIRHFCQHVADMHKDTNLLFLSEFQDLRTTSSKFIYPSRTSSGYDNSEDKNSSPQVKAEIDATYMPGLNSKHEYIVTPGPSTATTAQFWSLVWEQRTKVIVRVADAAENKTNAGCYWPSILNTAATYGDFTVRTIGWTSFNKCTLRDFKLSLGRATRRVIHFQIPAWWQDDSGILSHDLLDFVRAVRERLTVSNPGPLVVQCSADVGRTGTLIALDYFMQFIERHSLEDSVDVFHYVLQMRKNRRHMVRDESQYIFVFDALSDLIKKTNDDNVYDPIYAEPDNTDLNYKPLELRKTADSRTRGYANIAYANEVASSIGD